MPNKSIRVSSLRRTAWRALLLIFLSTGAAFGNPVGHHVVVETGTQSPANPLTVITLHGLGDSPENFARLVKRSTISARWIIPRATYRYGRGYSWFDIPPGALKRPQLLASEITRAVKRLALLVDEIRSEQEHGRRIVLMGFSQGGMLTYGYAATPGMQPLAGAIPIGGLLPKSLWPKHKTAFSIVALHGVDDSVVPFRYAKSTAAAFRARASDIEFFPFENVAHTVTLEMWQLVQERLLRFASGVQAP